MGTIRPAQLRRRDFLRAGCGVAASAVGGAVLAGCGNTSRAAFVTSSSRTLTQVKIVNTDTLDTLAFQELLTKRGYFKQFGVDATTTNVADGTKVTASISSGGSDIALMTGFGQIFPAIEKGANLKLLGATGALSTQSVWSGNPKIQSVKHLEGATVGIGAVGALLYQVMVALLQQAKVKPSKVTFLDIGSSTAVFKAVVAKRVDAGLASLAYEADQKKYGIHRVVDVWKEIPEYTYQGSFTSDRAIQTKRQGLIGTLAAYNKLFKFLQGPSSESPFVDAFVKVGGTKAQGQTLWKFYQKSHPFDTKIVLSDNAINYMQQLNVTTKAQHQVLPISEVADMSLAKAAAKETGSSSSSS